MATEPVHFSEELAQEICEAISTSTDGIRKLCLNNPHWPDRVTIYKWTIRFPSFGNQYAQAKARQVEWLAEEILDISDDGSLDTITRKGKDGSEYEVCDHEWVQRSRLRIDTRKWLASKLAPKLYGDRLLVEKEDPNADPEILRAKSIVDNLKDDKNGQSNSAKS